MYGAGASASRRPFVTAPAPPAEAAWAHSASVSGRWKWKTSRLRGSGSSRFVNRVSTPVLSYKNGSVVVNIPQPTDISTKVAGQPNFFSSLIHEVLSYPKTVQGKGYMVGVGCKNHKRPWTATFTAHKYGGGSETQTVSGATHC